MAGATFMAAGSSAPELATVIIGVFFAKDDIGVSGVIGSAVFNIMFVISVSGEVDGPTKVLRRHFIALKIERLTRKPSKETLYFPAPPLLSSICVVLHCGLWPSPRPKSEPPPAGPQLDLGKASPGSASTWTCPGCHPRAALVALTLESNFQPLNSKQTFM